MNTPSNVLPLTDPRDRPEADVVVFDGQCRFCTGQVQRLARWDRQGRLAYLSLHDERVAQWCGALTREQLMQQMYVLTNSGKRYGGAAAARYLSRRLPRLWPLAPLLHIPGSLGLWQWLYRQVAKRRYRYSRDDSCETGSCDVHCK